MTTVAYFGTIMEDEVGRQLRKIGSEDPKWKETWRQNEWNSRKKKKKNRWKTSIDPTVQQLELKKKNERLEKADSLVGFF